MSNNTYQPRGFSDDPAFSAESARDAIRSMPNGTVYISLCYPTDPYVSKRVGGEDIDVLLSDVAVSPRLFESAEQLSIRSKDEALKTINSACDAGSTSTFELNFVQLLVCDNENEPVWNGLTRFWPQRGSAGVKFHKHLMLKKLARSIVDNTPRELGKQGEALSANWLMCTHWMRDFAKRGPTPVLVWCNFGEVVRIARNLVSSDEPDTQAVFGDIISFYDKACALRVQ